LTNIEIISAPSILGLKPSGVELLAETLINAGLQRGLNSSNSILYVETLNDKYSNQRDTTTQLLNPGAIKDFSIRLADVIDRTLSKNRFPLVLGGDCSILIGIMSALKAKGNYGLIFLDAHADFYEPEKSVTGEVADMDLAVVTGRGPDVIANIKGLRPYVRDEHVIHVGQRDWEQTRAYNSQDIRDTEIKCFSLDDITANGTHKIALMILKHISKINVDGFWIHFDTDVLSDDVNPAVDYRLPGGLQFEDAEFLIRNLLHCRKIVGLDVTIFNPNLDRDGSIARKINACLMNAFQ
jgi:arginase